MQWTLGCMCLGIMVFSRCAQEWNCWVMWGSIFSFLRNLHIVLYGDCINVQSHRQCGRAPFSPHPLQHLSFVGFLLMAIFTSVRWCLTAVLSCISLIISGIEHLFMCLLTSACLLCSNVCLDLPPSFWWGCLFFYTELHELFLYFGD